METILKIKRKGKPNIAPLQPPTLATFRSWGSSAGAGRAGLPAAKVRKLAYDTRDQAGKDAGISCSKMQDADTRGQWSMEISGIVKMVKSH